MQISKPREAIAQLAEAAVDLVLHHNILPLEITGAISKRLREEAEHLPKLEVLYNDAYGGFEYSQGFEEYLPVRRGTSSHRMLQMPSHMPPYKTAGPADRIDACGHIRPFGQEQAHRWPFAFQVVLSYYAYELDNIGCDMHTLAYKQADPEATETARKACADLPAGLLKLYKSHVEEEAASRRHAHLDPERCDFYQKIRELGEENEKIWEAQHHLDHNIMICLHRRCLRGSSIEQQDKLPAAHQAFGLVCASGAYCRLAVREVPQLVEWAIREYDGLESVVIK